MPRCSVAATSTTGAGRRARITMSVTSPPFACSLPPLPRARRILRKPSPAVNTAPGPSCRERPTPVALKNETEYLMVVAGKGSHPLEPYNNALPVRPAPVQGLIRPPRPAGQSLGMTAADARELQAAILAAARSGTAFEKSADTYGRRYVMDLTINRGERAAMVRSAWILKHGEDIPRLTSCYVL